MLTELELQNRKAARSSFINAVWEGEEPAKLLPLASAAGLTGEEADRLVRQICRGKEQIERTNRLPALRKEAVATKARFEKIQAHAKAEITRLEDEMETAAIEADTALKAQCAAERDSRELLMLHDEGLLRSEDTPKEVLWLIERRAAEERSLQAHAARTAAVEERNQLRSSVRDLEARLADMTLTIHGPRGESTLRNKLRDAKRQLNEVEDRLKKAESAADAARKAIPQVQ